MKVLSKCHEDVIAKNEAEGGNDFKWIVKQDRGHPRVVRIKAEDPMGGKAGTKSLIMEYWTWTL